MGCVCVFVCTESEQGYVELQVVDITENRLPLVSCLLLSVYFLEVYKAPPWLVPRVPWVLTRPGRCLLALVHYTLCENSPLDYSVHTTTQQRAAQTHTN